MKSKPDTLFLTPEAKSDITDILNYTIATWGVEQAKVYADRLYKGFKLLLENPLLGRQRDDIIPGYWIWRIEKHFAIYRLEHKQISVIRMLHVNRDIVNQFLILTVSFPMGQPPRKRRGQGGQRPAKAQLKPGASLYL